MLIAATLLHLFVERLLFFITLLSFLFESSASENEVPNNIVMLSYHSSQMSIKKEYKRPEVQIFMNGFVAQKCTKLRKNPFINWNKMLALALWRNSAPNITTISSSYINEELRNCLNKGTRKTIWTQNLQLGNRTWAKLGIEIWGVVAFRKIDSCLSAKLEHFSCNLS